MKKLSFVFCLFLLLIPSVSAQDDVDNLLELINAVPDLPEVRESLITFVDYGNVLEARPGAPVVLSYNAIDLLPDPFGGIFMAAYRGIYSGPEYSRNLFRIGDEMEATVGFDFFTIDRAMNFGTPPASFDVLVGEFDTDAIADALSARDYTSEPLGDMTVWCGNEDCDGTIMDLENRNPANIFGGDLGRSFPVLVSDTTVVATAAEQGLILVEDAIGDRFDSLADNVNYAATINVIDRDNILIQGAFVHPSVVITDIASMVIEGDTDAIEAAMEEAVKLPPYNLIMIADTATDEEQVVYVTLVYNNESDAETAIEVIPERIQTMDSLRVQRPIQELFDDREITIMPQVVFDEDNGRYLAVFEMRAPLADNEEVDGFLTSSSMVYQLFIQMIYSRDTLWLANSNS